MPKTETLPKYSITIPPLPGRDYAVDHLKDSFDWKELALSLSARRVFKKRVFAVAFRSTKNPTADTDLLTKRDDAAHWEGFETNNLLYYFRGDPKDNGQNLSFCIWKNAKAAKKSAQGKWHQEAVKVARQMYKDFSLEKFYLSRSGETIIFKPVKERRVLKKVKKILHPQNYHH